jgi:hypothetical protein
MERAHRLPVPESKNEKYQRIMNKATEKEVKLAKQRAKKEVKKGSQKSIRSFFKKKTNTKN